MTLIAPPMTPSREPKRGKKSVLGFVENVFDDAFELLKGLYQIIPTIAKSAPEAFDWEGLKLLAKDPAILGRELKHTGSAVVDAVVEPYRTHGAAVVYYRPVSTALDALAIWSLGSGTLARAGKLAGASKAVTMSKVATGAKLTGAERLLHMGMTLDALPGKLARGGIDIAAKRIGIDLPAKRKYLTLKREEFSREPLKVKEDMGAVGNKLQALSSEEAALWHKWRVQGASNAEVAAYPKVLDALESHRKLVEGTWQAELKGRALLNDAQIEEALVKKYAAEVFENIKAESLVEARRRIALAEVKPIYGPAIFEKTGAYTLDEFLTIPGTTRTGAVGFLEEFKGGKGAIKDPRVYVPKAIQGFRHVEAKLRLIERVLQDPSLVRSVGAGEALKKEIIPEGIFRRYFFDRARAQGVVLREVIKEKGVEGARAATIGDPAVQQRIMEAKNIIAEPTLRRLITHEFTRPTGAIAAVLRLHDWVLGLFKKSATIFNPKWYVGNVVGDAILGELAGTQTLRAIGLVKRGIAPSEVLAGGGMAGTATGIGGFIDKATEIGAHADRAVRAGIVTKRVADKFTSIGLKGEAAQAATERALVSTTKLSEVQVRLELAQEAIVRTVPRIRKADKEIAATLIKAGRLESAARGLQQAITTTGRTEADILSRIEALDARRIKFIAEGEAARASQAAAAREIKKLTREGLPGVTRRLERAMRQEERAAAAWYRDILVEIRRRGGVRPLEGLAEEFQRVPKGLRSSKGIAADELAQELADRGIIADAATDTLLDFIDTAVVAVRRGKVDVRAVRAEARALVASQGGRGIEEIIKTTREQAQLKQELTGLRKLKRGGEERLQALAKSKQDRLAQVQDALTSVRQEVVNAEKVRVDVVRDLTDDWVKAGNLEKEVPGLAEDAAITREAVDYANSFLGEYVGLSGFEQGVMRRIIPFYVWSKTMTMLAFRIPFLAPVKTFMWNRYSAAMMTMAQDKDLPEWMNGHVPVFVRANGDTVWFSLKSYSPFGSLRVTQFGDVPIPSIAALGEQNPFLGVLFQLQGGKNIFQKTNLPYGEPVVNISNGDVYEFTEDGTLRKIIPQAPLIGTVAHMFPTAQLLENLLTPYVTNKHNWLGIPEPVLNPDGSYKYPRELWQRLVSPVARVDVRSRQSLINAEKRKVRQAIISLRGAYRRADVEERKYLREALDDYARGEYRRIESR